MSLGPFFVSFGMGRVRRPWFILDLEKPVVFWEDFGRITCHSDGGFFVETFA